MKTKYQIKSHPKNESDSHHLDFEPIRDSQALLIPVSMIEAPKNPRTNLGDISELKASIAEQGILTPLLIIRTAGKIELLAGHRRLLCAKDLGLEHVPCRITETDKPDVVRLIDNILREELSAEDECLAIKDLLHTFDGNKSSLGRAISKSPSYVTRAIKAAGLIESGLCAGANLSKSAIMELADAADPKAVLASASDGTKESIRRARSAIELPKPNRKPSGAIPGGRAVSNAFRLNETKGGGFTLSVNFDPSRTPPADRLKIKDAFEMLLKKLC